jgi:phage-related protein
MPVQTTENQRATAPAARQAHTATQPAVCLQCKHDPWAGTRRVLQAAAASMAQLKLAVGRPGDPYEREAERAAAQLAGDLPVSPLSSLPPGGLPSMRSARPEEEKYSVQKKSAAAEKEDPQTLQAFGGGDPVAGALDEPLTRAPSGGAPLPEETRGRMERGFGADFSGVRVHTGAEAAQLNQGLQAQAFTRGNHIYFAAGRYEPESSAGRHLVAHELAHVVQQGATHQGRTPQPTSGATVQRNGERSERGLLGRIWDATGGRMMQAGADLVWGLLRERAPQLAELLQAIRRVGIVGYLRERIGGAVSRIFNGLRANHAVAARLFQVFNLILGQATVIISGLRSGSCRPLFAAIERLKQTVSRVAGDAWEAITEFFRPVGDFFADIWRRFGAPAVEWIRDVAGDVWEYITGLGRNIWEWMAPVRRAFSDAWEWLKAQLGIGGDQGNDSGGLVQWVRDQAGEAWRAIRETLAPVIAPIQGVVQRIREILPLEAIANLRETVTGWLNQVGSMTQRLEQENGVADQQTSLRQDILPGVLRAIRQLRTRIAGAGQWVAGRIGRLADAVQGFFGGLAGQALLRPVIALLRWVPEGVGRFNQWAQSTVRRLFDSLGNGLVYLSQFIEPVLGTLQKVVEVLGDLAGKLSELIFGRFWRLIPGCIRDPIKDFIVTRILSNIPVFGQLLRIPDIWQRVQATAMRILRQVFVSGDLLGAAWTFFREVLNLINIPAQLVTGIIRKAASALGDILSNPISFLVNLVQGLVRGLVQFCGNIGRHLLSGISGWLFGQLRQAGIQPPSDFSLASILGFVLQVLDITRERIFQRMARHPRIGPERVARLRTFFNRLSGAWEWVRVLINDGPAGLWRMLRERLGNLWQSVLNSIISWISTRVVSRALARLATMADPSGIGAVVNIIVTVYQAIQTAAQYARQILEAVNRFLDGINSIARGALGPAAAFLENALVRLLPAAIGFVANWVGLGGLGQRIREMVERIRAQVDRALDWLIERGVRTVDAVLRGLRAVGGAIRGGAQRLLQWWRIRKRFSARNAETHTLYFEGENVNARLMIQSEIKTYVDFVNEIKVNRGLDNDDPRIVGAADTAARIDALKRTVVTDEHGTRDQTPQFTALLDELAERTSDLLGPTSEEAQIPVSTPPQYGSVHGSSGFATSMSIDVLSMLHPPGSEPAVTNRHWESLRKRKSSAGGRTYYVLGHLLNNRLGGSGTTWQNLSPLRQEDNQDHERRVERPIKEAVEATGAENKIFAYDVAPSYVSSLISSSAVNVTSSQVAPGQDPAVVSEVRNAERYIPVSFRCQAVELDKTTLEPKTGGQQIRESIPNRIETDPSAYNVSGGSLVATSVDLNADDESKLTGLPGIGNAGAEALIHLRSSVGPFTDIQDARDRYTTYRLETRPTLRALSAPWPHKADAPPFVVDIS